MREYLLRTLSDAAAEAIEERYFVDDESFWELRAAEVKLICDYLDGHLSEPEEKQFASHYLPVDALHVLVQDVHSRRGAMRREGTPHAALIRGPVAQKDKL